ncbi:MAG: hypothetical protein DI566_13485 [Microbacterium sp.]|nr:MAG: hypothetical protein DI566_13485 [Microbacterium sp.]
MSKPAAQIALCAALPLEIPAGAGKAPEWIHLFPMGEIRTVDGRGPYRLTDAAKVVANFAAGDRLPIDENHATDYAAPSGGASPARGWIIGLQARQDGVWGQVEWTRWGRQLVKDKAYRHISPAMVHSPSGEVIGVARASLVNLPNLVGLTALHQQQGPSMTFIEQLRQALGLPETADEAAVLAAATRANAMVATHAAIAKHVGAADGAEPAVVLQSVQALAKPADAAKAVLAPIVAALGLPADATAEVALQSVQALKDPAKNVPAATVIALQSQLTALSTQINRERAEAFVDAAIKDGKPIVALRDHYVARHMASPDSAKAVETEIGAMVALHGARPRPAPKAGEPAIDEADEAVIALMGVDRTKFAASREAEQKRA